MLGRWRLIQTCPFINFTLIMSDLKKHILIIEDEPDIAELQEYNLKTAGYRITKANNGEISQRCISRYRERMADHTTNISEDVIYMVEEEIARHGFSS